MAERTLLRRTAAHRWRTVAWPKPSHLAAHISPVITERVHSAPEQDERTTQGVKSPHTPQNTDTSTGRLEATCRSQSSRREDRPQRRQRSGHLCSGARPVSTPAQLQRPSIPKLLTRAPAFAFRWERQKGEPRRATQNERQMRSADKTKRRGGHATSRTRAQACSHAGRSRIADGRFKEAPRKTKTKLRREKPEQRERTKEHLHAQQRQRMFGLARCGRSVASRSRPSRRRRRE